MFKFFRKKTPPAIQLEDLLCDHEFDSEQVRRAFAAIAETDSGRLCISYLLINCGVTKFQRVNNNDDRLRKEGQRQLGFSILELLALDGNQIHQVIMNRVQARANASASQPTSYNHE